MTFDKELTDYRDLFEHAPCGYLLVDAGVICMVNVTLAEWLNFSASELVGKRLPDIFTVSGRVVFETGVLPLLALQEHVDEVAMDLVARDETRIPVSMSVRLALDASQQHLTRIVFVKAASRRRFERDLISARQNAEQGLLHEQEEGALREQFIAILGHDLRNPLAAISAATRMLLREALTPRGKKVLSLMGESTSRMALLTENMLDFARARLGGGIALKLSSDQPLEPLITQVVDELRLTAPDTDVRVFASIRTAIQYDPARIAQMLSNLLGNAFHHGDRSRPIIIEASTLQDGTFRLCVSNSGNPIPDELQAKLFTPFVTGVEPGQGRGLGLGLHIAAEIAKAHGGTLSFTSDNESTCFTFLMPDTSGSVSADLPIVNKSRDL